MFFPLVAFSKAKYLAFYLVSHVNSYFIHLTSQKGICHFTSSFESKVWACFVNEYMHFIDVCERPTNFLGILWSSSVEINQAAKLLVFILLMPSMKSSWHFICCITVTLLFSHNRKLSQSQTSGVMLSMWRSCIRYSIHAPDDVESEFTTRTRPCSPAGITQLVQRWTRDRKPAGLVEEFSFSLLTFYAVIKLFSVCWTLMSLQWHVKDPSHSAKSADSTYTLDPMKLEWADHAIV